MIRYLIRLAYTPPGSVLDRRPSATARILIARLVVLGAIFTLVLLATFTFISLRIVLDKLDIGSWFSSLITAFIHSGTYSAAAIGAAIGVVMTLWTSRSIYVGRQRYGDHLLPGMPLAALRSYPVEVEPDGRLRLDLPLVERACLEVLETSNPRAAADLLYLTDNNRAALAGSPSALHLLRRVRKQYRRHRHLMRLESLEGQRAELIGQFYTITEGLGDTFAGVPIEFVLHDARNPLRSVLDIRNPITGRMIGDQASAFGRELIVTYAMSRWAGTQHSYRISNPRGGEIKATTIPLEHRALGLVALLSINISIDRLSPSSPELAELTHRLILTYRRGEEIIEPGGGPHVWRQRD